MVQRVTANPCGVVTEFTGSTEPSPEPTTQVTARPPTPLSFWSTSCTTSESASWNPAGALWPSPEIFTSRLGVAGTAVWMNVRGDPWSPAAVAWADSAPELPPSTRSAAARPSSPVTTTSGEMEPPPLALQWTSMPATGFPPASITRATSESGSAELTAPVCSLPLAIWISVAAPDTACAVSATSTPSGASPPCARAVSD